MGTKKKTKGKDSLKIAGGPSGTVPMYGTKTVNGKLFGMPIWYSLHSIVQDAVLKYTFSASRTNVEAMRFLGLKKAEMRKLIKKYNIDNYFSEKEVDKDT